MYDFCDVPIKTPVVVHFHEGMGKWFSKYSKSLQNNDFMAIPFLRKGNGHFPPRF